MKTAYPAAGGGDSRSGFGKCCKCCGQTACGAACAAGAGLFGVTWYCANECEGQSVSC